MLRATLRATAKQPGAPTKAEGAGTADGAAKKEGDGSEEEK